MKTNVGTRISAVILAVLMTIMFMPLMPALQVHADQAGPLTVEADGDTNFEIRYGDEAEMRAIATGGSGELTYSWERSDRNEDDYSVIEGAASDTYKTGLVGDYRCTVTDEDGNTAAVDFSVRSYDGLYAYAANSTVKVEKGETATLKVNVDYYDSEAESGELSYQWMTYDSKTGKTSLIEGATDSSYTTPPVNQGCEYRCKVKNQYGDTDTADFKVFPENGLTAEADGTDGETDATVTAAPGQDAVLKVNASVNDGGITYKWSRFDEEDTYDYVPVESDGTDTYTVKNVAKNEKYRCEVIEDKYGASVTIDFNVNVDNGLSVEPDGDSEVSVEPGGDVTLKTKAVAKEGTLSYQWKMYDDSADRYRTIYGAHADTYTIKAANRTAEYRCTVSDQFGNEESTDFTVTINNDLTVDPEKKHITVKPDEKSVLNVNATAKHGKLTYTWYRYDEEEYEYVKLASGQDTYTVEPDDYYDFKIFYCEVEDEYQNTQRAYFYITVDNGFTAKAKNENIHIEPGSSVTMEVEASCDKGKLTY